MTEQVIDKKYVLEATPGQEGPFYPFDKDGKFLGSFAGFNVQLPPETAGCAPGAPEHADDVWSGSDWVNSPEYARAKARVRRTEAVKAITVETRAGNVFDGDEISQDRMARTIVALDKAGGDAKTKWILHDNKVIEVTAAELTEALTKAGEAQTSIWVI